jgi:hypothetical protein
MIGESTAVYRRPERRSTPYPSSPTETYYNVHVVNVKRRVHDMNKLS